jgi:hypothetical protein
MTDDDDADDADTVGDSQSAPSPGGREGSSRRAPRPLLGLDIAYRKKKRAKLEGQDVSRKREERPLRTGQDIYRGRGDYTDTASEYRPDIDMGSLRGPPQPTEAMGSSRKPPRPR